MSDRAVELFERFLDERQAGQRPDPAAFVTQAGDQAEALSGMIAAYLATSPPRCLSADEVREFAARPELEPLGAWSENRGRGRRCCRSCAPAVAPPAGS